MNKGSTMTNIRRKEVELSGVSFVFCGLDEEIDTH